MEIHLTPKFIALPWDLGAAAPTFRHLSLDAKRQHHRIYQKREGS